MQIFLYVHSYFYMDQVSEINIYILVHNLNNSKDIHLYVRINYMVNELLFITHDQSLPTPNKTIFNMNHLATSFFLMW